MKSGDEMFQNVLKRRNAYREKNKKRISIIKKTVSLAACFCFIISGYSIWQHKEKIPQSSISNNNENTDIYSNTEKQTIPDNTENNHSSHQFTENSQHNTDKTAVNQNTDAITAQPDSVVSTEPQQTECPSYQPEDIQTKPHTPSFTEISHQTESPSSQPQDFLTETKPSKPQQTDISADESPSVTMPPADDVSPIVTTIPHNTENSSSQSDNFQTVTQPQQTDISDDEPMPPGIDAPPTVTSTDERNHYEPEPSESYSENSPAKKHFELQKNAYDYNGEKWNQLIFTGADDNTEIHGHSFEIQGFTLISENDKVINLRDNNGINYTIYMYTYDEFKIGLNPKSKSTYEFYEINGRQAVREICHDDYYIGIEYKPNLIAWDDGCHICFTYIADMYYNQVENLIKNQITY